MTYVHSVDVSVTTDSSGDATSYSEVVNGIIDRVEYTKTDFAAGVDFTITTEDSEQNVWVEANVDASDTVRPAPPLHNPDDGTAIDPLAVGVLAVNNERIKIVIANGGDTKTGAFSIIMR